MTTDELEAYIDARYEAGAPQYELEALEMAYADRVSEDDLTMTEEDPKMQEDTAEGTHLEENLADAYRRYLQQDEERDGRMTKQEVISFMRAIIEDSKGINKGMKDVSDGQILAAAKDVYEYKRNLIKRYRSKKKLSNMPANLWAKR
jgi:hypothetical protein